jgi:antitoxin HicB
VSRGIADLWFVPLEPGGVGAAVEYRKGQENTVLKYPAVVRQLSDDEGGGYLAEIPDLPGCMADGDTAGDALANVESAIEEWIAAARELGRDIPEPQAIDQFSGKWVQRVPKSLHMRLVNEAKREGVSLNALTTTLIAEGLGKKFVEA